MGLSVNRYSLIVLLALACSCGNQQGNRNKEMDGDLKVGIADQADTSVMLDIIEDVEPKKEVSKYVSIYTDSFAGVYKFEDYTLHVELVDTGRVNGLLRKPISNQLITRPASPIVLNDSCFFLEFERADNDTICNHVNSSTGYFQRYSMNEEWKGNYVVYYEDWESSSKFLVNKKSAKWFSIGEDYSVLGDTLIYSNAELLNPLATSFLGMAIATKDSIEELFMFDFTTINPLSIEKTDEGFLLKVGLDNGNYQVGETAYYYLTFHDDKSNNE